MHFRLKAASLAFVAALGAAVAYFWLTPLALPGVQVSTGICDQSPSTQTTVQSSWSGQVLELAIDQRENCGVALHSASVQRLGSHLFVRTRYRSPSGMYTSCYCRHRTELGIPDLPQRTFQAHVYSWP